ncbi:PrsW family intramembrane metalloprotease [Candidatus Nomurabacteria bacterium]|nr:PrsW family intramembrane metalloprotease [Candidatus Nomurabacteria bacterium]
MVNQSNVILALIGGILPAFVWLVFWLREDKAHPEPRPLIAFIFLGGAVSVGVAFMVQDLVHGLWWQNLKTFEQLRQANLHQLVPYVFSSAMIEELIKYVVVALLALSTRFYDEPIDAMIYLITVSLGFAAAENSLFMLNALADSPSQVNFWLSGNFRFVGATIVHIVSSSVLGGFIALAFCKTRVKQFLALVGGLLAATALHASFNYFIIKSGDGEILRVFLLLWALAIVIIYLFEKVKFLVCKNIYE